MAIQALQPRVKEIQERYKGRDPQEAQVHAHCTRTFTPFHRYDLSCSLCANDEQLKHA